jgi:Flp pilus assembly protein TadD
MRACILLILITSLASCTSVDVEDLSSFGDSADTVIDTSIVDYYPDDQLITVGKVQFREGNYGKSYSLFKKAVEVVPNDPQAWLGFAASSDMVRRFDSSDIAYRKLAAVIGNRPEYYNNVGYSHLLRGNLKSARRHFLKAYELDPSNEFTANNLELLRNSVYHPKRGGTSTVASSSTAASRSTADDR